MLIVRIYRYFRQKSVEKSFRKHAALGKRARIHHTAQCSNDGKKEQITIDDHCEIKGNICCFGDGEVTIGKHFYMGGFSYIYSVDSISIGDCVIISNHVRIMDNNSHPTDPKKRCAMSIEGSVSEDGFKSQLWNETESDHAPTVIEDNVWIGEYAAILKGVTIGKGSVIGIHSVVTKNVPPYSIVAGNPARVVKTIQA